MPSEIRIADTGETPVGELGSPVAVPLVIVRAPGASAAQARNLIAAQARGEALAFLDDDDRWRPGHLEGLAAALAAPGTRFAFRDSVVVRERLAADGTRHDLETRPIARDWDDTLMRTDDYVPPSAWALERGLFDELGGFDPRYRFSDDWDLLLRARRMTVPVRAPGITVEVRMREGGNASADFGPERLADLERLEEQHGLARLVPKTFWEVAETVSRS